MIIHIVKCLGIYLTVLASVGGVFFIGSKTKHKKIILIMILFMLSWRYIADAGSTRYYSALLLVGVFSASFFIHTISISTSQSKTLKNCFITILICTAALEQTFKVFNSFNDLYIDDLQTMVKCFARNNPDAWIDVYPKERHRLLHDINYEHTKGIDFNPPKIESNLTEYYVANSFFPNELFYIGRDITIDKGIASQGENNNYFIYAHFKSNKTGDKSINVYKHKIYYPEPDIDINTISPALVFQTYVPQYDTFIYRDNNKFFWLIGEEIDKSVEIIFLIYPENTDLLPKSRKQYGFDNKGFRYNANNSSGMIGKYMLFEKEIPKEYSIKKIVFGFNTSDLKKKSWIKINY